MQQIYFQLRKEKPQKSQKPQPKRKPIENLAIKFTEQYGVLKIPATLLAIC